MSRLHRITERTLMKHKGLVWVDVSHLGSNVGEKFSISLKASKTKEGFKNHWAERGIIKIGYNTAYGRQEMKRICRDLLKIGVPLDCFEMHGSSTWTTENLRTYIDG